MPLVTIVCARCTLANHLSDRYCAGCGLPMGALQPDAEAGSDALGPLRAPRTGRPRRDPADHRICQANPP